ncbi:hypothetical protein POSPLADRAFT_1065711 [Postia placenta MAD-698-R-SB12]|uniref:Uncharacterized protein n=1 Tax=Postia placenta MAD-698-R-SB12 TaxID=670580 RepID=A0A1X6N499_9APHY|nr:hypothetical protein POSPLADRAFT_1065711 [Postia placenta MAD-698-R-SB12]OSX63469.1 hypothetical protein POSPLADRAFT_1065711 [Postia placenta MAD-698-R-SB12]
MLPFALRVAWVVLSATGLLCSLVGSPRFVSALGGLWIPIAYGIANVTLQVVFCLEHIHPVVSTVGMIWHMNAYIMPLTFCVAQAAFKALAWFVMTSLCATMTITTSVAILRAQGARVLSELEIQKALRSRVAFLSLVIGFPAVAFTAYIAVSSRLHAVRNYVDMTCDASDPLWVRLLSFAGLPLLLAIPSFVLSCTCVICLLSTRQRFHAHSQLPRGEVFDMLTSLPRRRTSRDKRHTLYSPSGLGDAAFELKALPSLESQPLPDASRRTPAATSPMSSPSMTLHALPTPPHSISSGTALALPGRAPTQPTVAHAQRFHLPFSWRPPSSRASPENEPSHGDRTSFFSQSHHSQSPSPMLFAPPSNPPSSRTTPVGLPVFPSLSAYSGTSNDGPRPVITGYEDLDNDAMSGSLRWAHNSDASSRASSKSDLEFAVDGGEDDSSDDRPHLSITDRKFTAFQAGHIAVPHPHSHSISIWERSAPDPRPAHESTVVWRVLFFQLLLSGTQILASISSLVDMFASRGVPTPFGTQHVALLLAAWAPVLAFGILPWRRKAR